ncbi:MAG: HAMP domain-containing sensor histidine kinase [Patescibacteria group bacterium]|jgi:signal transduction histidine kinase
MFRDIKVTTKILAIFVVLVILIVNSWAFTFTTVLDFRNTFTTIQDYSFPSVVTTAELKDDVHVGMLAVYTYITTGDPTSKTLYQEHFNQAIQTEYRLFQLSQTSADFEFTQKFNDKLLDIYNQADSLVTLYESEAPSEDISKQLAKLNTSRAEFNNFVETTITDQTTAQVTETGDTISKTVNQTQYYLFGVLVFVVIVIIFVWLFVSNNITKPIRKLTAAVQSFGKGEFHRVTITHNDELGLFAKTFNTMAENIQKSQAALEEELEKTKQLDRQKSEFLSIAAHQLRTPMSGIRWVSQMLYDGDMGDLSEQQKHHMGNALENINRMILLINDLLDVTKIEEQRFTYKFVHTDLVKICQDQITALAQLAKNQTVTVNLIHEPAGALLTEVDVEKISMAINNLIDNAIKYSKTGGSVEVSLSKHGNTIHGSIRDHGIGIPKKSQAEVFTKFFRAPNVLKIITEGSGLGLFLAKDIVAKHNGKIWFESEENIGTTFFFDLPVTQSPS